MEIGDAQADTNSRLRQARQRAGFTSARSAALRFGWIPSTYASHENGQTPVPTRLAPTYARAFKVSAAWLLTGEGPRESRTTIMVLGFIGAGAEITPAESQVPPHGLAEIELAFALPENAVAFEVQSASLWPRYEPGDIILCWNEQHAPGDLVGREAIAIVDGRRYLRRPFAGVRKGTFDLETFNAEPIRGARISSVREVFAVVRAQQRPPAP
ncbi:MAG: hypothetical protein ACLPKB_20425 [Xanthobacteraceae bacterium]